MNANVMGLLIALLFVCGCVTTVSQKELDTISDRMFMDSRNQSSVSATYYVGSDDNYDYFVIGTVRCRKQYRVERNESKVTNRFQKTQDQSKWRGAGNIFIPIY